LTFKAIGRVNHPFHLHGYAMRIMDMGQDPNKNPLTQSSTAELLKKRQDSLTHFKTKFPIKDTISIPSRGYTVFRFRADNPGWWFLHCHYEWHSSVGMGLVLQVGEKKDMIKTPDRFPKCNNYAPDVEF
jgi:FtsP/CotA-like multicopper oxidase with cupredoxin domain